MVVQNGHRKFVFISCCTVLTKRTRGCLNLIVVIKLFIVLVQFSLMLFTSFSSSASAVGTITKIMNFPILVYHSVTTRRDHDIGEEEGIRAD